MSIHLTETPILRSLDRGCALLAYIGVLAYRHYISPRKGFKCAHAALTKEPSCSDVAAIAFWEHPFSEAVPIVRAQLALCRSTYMNRSKDLMSSAADRVTKLAVYGTVGYVVCCPCCCDPPTPPNQNPTAPPPSGPLD